MTGAMSKAPFILLVNPWITDFAAFDLWSKPLGLLALGALLREGGCGVALVDCLDRSDPYTGGHPGVLPGSDKPFGTGKFPRMRIEKPDAFSGFPRRFHRYGIHPESFRRRLRALGRPALVWVTSIMTYWYPGVRMAIEILREELPGTPVWLGGIYAALCPEHARLHSGPDRVLCGGPGELPALIEASTGFSVKNRNTWDRFEDWPPPALDLLERPLYAPLITSIGCPYRCPYCASRILQPRCMRLGAEKIYNQVMEAHRVTRCSDFAFYDDALLLDGSDTLGPALERVAAEGCGFRFHVPNAVHVRALTPEWCGLLRRAGFTTLRLGLETTRDEKNRAWGGKVDTAMFLRAVENLTAAGFAREGIGVYLLCGLPGQSPGEVAEAIRIVRGAGVRPYLAEYSPIPGTPMWRDAVSASRFDLASEPLYHNNTFFACRRPDFTYDDLLNLKKMAKAE
jgi:radical SAM superfamily enzyme YgiQ (UPF0313 family)